jgi:glycosyltransferase involved in cell wall biosynthesis
MKIGFFIPNATFDLPGSAEVGGIETFSFTVGEAMQRLGHDVVLYGGRPKFGRQHQSTLIPLKLFDYWETKDIPDIGTRFQRLVQRLHFGWKSRKEWRAEKLDVVILAKPFDWPLAWFWKKRQPGLKAIMGYHGTDYYPGDRLFYSAIDAAFADSNEVAELALQRTGKKPEVIFNPTDTDFFNPSKAAPGEKNDLFQIVSIARLVGWKGQTVLLEAFADWCAARPDAVLTLAGDGPDLDKLKAEVASRQLQDRVRLTGNIGKEKLRELLAISDLFVAPSIGLDAFPITVVNAACMGIPLLLSDRIGVREALAEEDFLEYPHGDKPSLKKQLEFFYQNRHRQSADLRQSKHLRYRSLFSPEGVAQKIIQLAG